MAGLFDNRYRYDHIYPRGRSGETLRGVDTQADERPVVIKRPAPQDAPPLRAAQEVSIQTERKALERLSGHPVLTELHATGTFRAGGQTYHYIVMARAEGQTVEDLILSPPRHPLTELEILTLTDQLLDLLAVAHAQHVIYNDVDAKHLFWNRDTGRLKVIDWGNAVFKDEAGASPNITPVSDVYQVGELLYFMFQGGARLNSETTPDGEYLIHFDPPLPAPLADIITRATHPNLKNRRFPTIRALRQALDSYRLPLVRERDAALSQIRAGLSENASKNTLERLAGEAEAALMLDPSYPETRRLQGDIAQRLRHLTVQADFDAARIYLETGNWARTIHLLDELIPHADPYMASALSFLSAGASEMAAQGISAPPPGFDPMLDALLNGRVEEAAQALLAPRDATTRTLRYLLVERMSALLPGLTLLRPQLTRLETALANSGLGREVSLLIRQLDSPLEPGIAPLMDRYSKFAIQLADWSPDFERQGVEPGLIERAESAVRALINHLKRLSETAYSQPTIAEVAYRAALTIDPDSPHFAALPAYLEQVRQVLQAAGTFRPGQDGQGLEAWLVETVDALALYTDISDPNFRSAAHSLINTYHYWETVQDMLALGRGRNAVERLRKMADEVRPYNAQVAGWFENNARLIQDAEIPERYAPNRPLGEALLDGYRAWDVGQVGRAAEFARRAVPIAATEGEALAAERLATLADITAGWLNEGGLTSIEKSRETDRAARALFFEDENAEYERFSQQMKSEDAYLKAMRLSLVGYFKRSSTAGYRALFLHYIMQGMLAVLEDLIEEADFWRQAALTANEDWKTHPLFTAFDGALTRRQLVLRAQEALNGVRTFADLAAARQALNAPLADAQLRDATQAVGQVEAAVGNWADGDFRGVRDNLNKALDNLTQAEKNGSMTLSPLRNWLTPYRDTALELLDYRQVVEQAAMEASLTPDPKVLQAFERIATASERVMGAEASRQMRLWLDIYRNMLRTHQDGRLDKRAKLAQFDTHFAALFIQKHPAYRLFERWYQAARELPEDVQEELQIQLEGDTTGEAPVYVENVGRAGKRTTAESAPVKNTGLPADDLDYDPDNPYADLERPNRTWNIVIGLSLLILVGLAGFAAFQVLNQGDDGGTTRLAATATRVDVEVLSPGEATGTAEARATEIAAAAIANPSATPLPVTPTPRSLLPTDLPSDTPEASPTVPTIAPTLTPSIVVTILTNTPPAPVTPSLTPLPPSATSAPPTAIPSPTATVSIALAGGTVDGLRALSRLTPEQYDWNAGFFSQGAGEVWQFGASVDDAGTAPIAILFDPDFMETFAPDAANRLRRAEIEIELTVYDETRIDAGQVFFGFGLQNSARQRYGAQVQLRPNGLVSFGLNSNGTYSARSQIPMARVAVTLSLQRQDDGTVTFFINGQRVGASPALYPLDEAVTLVLYDAGGGMFMNITALTLDFAPPQ